MKLAAMMTQDDNGVLVQMYVRSIILVSELDIIHETRGVSAETSKETADEKQCIEEELLK